MWYIIGIIALVLAIPITFIVLIFLPINVKRLNPLHRLIATKIYQTWKKYLDSIPEDQVAIVTYDEMIEQLCPTQKYLTKKVFSIEPGDLGFKGQFYGKEKAENLVKLEPVFFTLDDQKVSTEVQYCPKHSYDDFVKMAAAMKEDIGKTVFIDSGYRSPGKQAYLFFYELVENANFSLLENARWIAMPGYSEHGAPVNNAVDVINEEGICGQWFGQVGEDFEKLPEFTWLMENASKYNFHLSYPRDNEHGVGFEPWHWHWEKKEITAA